MMEDQMYIVERKVICRLYRLHGRGKKEIE